MKLLIHISLTLTVYARNLLRESCLREIFFSYFVLFDIYERGLNHRFLSNKPTHYPLDDYSDSSKMDFFLGRFLCWKESV